MAKGSSRLLVFILAVGVFGAVVFLAAGALFVLWRLHATSARRQLAES